MNLLFTFSLFGCYKDFQDLSEIDLQDIPFENEALQSTGALVSTFTADLECPDGKPATFFAVYPENAEESAIAIVFHSGAWDYQDTENELAFNYPSHMTQSWAKGKVWETLGMNNQVLDASETNNGSLATALLDANVVQIYPANCWGDLWHNQSDESDNNYELEDFTRSGRTMAYWMTQLLQNPNFPGTEGFQIPQPYNSDEIYWIGLGDGGRAISELLQRGVTPPKGILLDSVPADLQPYKANAADFPQENLAFERIFVDDEQIPFTDLSQFALSQSTSGPERLAILWSDGDTQIPMDSLMDSFTFSEMTEDTWSYNTHQTGHIFSNSQISMSREIVGYLLDGTPPDESLFVEEIGEE